MAKKESQTVKGCRKCGRTLRKEGNTGNPISNYIRGKITAEQYFKTTNQKVKTS
jgi:hypothetical protein